MNSSKNGTNIAIDAGGAAETADDRTARLAALMTQLLAVFGEFDATETFSIMTKRGLSLAEVATLHGLLVRGPQTISAIAERLNLSRPTVSVLVDHLVRQGLVARREDTVDRRRKTIEILDAGVGVLQKLAESRTRECVQVIMRLSSKTIADVERVMQRIIAEMGRTTAG